MGIPTNGYPIPGTLQPVAYRARARNPPLLGDSLDIMDLLVTTYIKSGVTIGFRFYPQTEGYLSGLSSTVCFKITSALNPGECIRLTDGGNTLKVVTFDPITPYRVIGTSLAEVYVRDYASCYIFWTPCLNKVVGISYIGFRLFGGLLDAVGLAPFAPPACALPCQFGTIVSVTSDTAPDAEGKYVYYDANTRGIPGDWINAWQLLKYNGNSGWTVANLSTYAVNVLALEKSFFVRLLPGQLLPIGYRPHFLDEVSGAAELVLVATKPIPPNTSVFISVASDARNCQELDVLWVWTSPDYYLLAGKTVNLRGLGYYGTPRVSVGTVVAAGTWPTSDFEITGFRVFSLSTAATPVDLTEYNVTALLCCDNACPIPEGLVPGFSMPSLPWPCCSSVLLIPPCKAPIEDWECEQLRLAKQCPVAWNCQPAPVFPVFDPCAPPDRCCVCEDPVYW